MLEGDLSNGELEIGQIAGLVHDVPTVKDLVDKLVADYRKLILKKI
jgi:NAD(P)H-dependent flavin oxidoreductase YrpB (nitropropane dioxygenase family)